MATREELRWQKEERERAQQEAYRRERAAISKRRSISVEARERGIPRNEFFQMLIDQGRLKPDHTPTEPYKQYEHPTQYGQGYSYDPEFFEGVD